MADEELVPHPDDDPQGGGASDSEFDTYASIARALVDYSPSLIFSKDEETGVAAWLTEGFIPLDDIGPIRGLIDESQYPDGVPSKSLRFKTFGESPRGNDAALVLALIDDLRAFLNEMEAIANDAAQQIDSQKQDEDDG